MLILVILIRFNECRNLLSVLFLDNWYKTQSYYIENVSDHRDFNAYDIRFCIILTRKNSRREKEEQTKHEKNSRPERSIWTVILVK